MDEYPILKEDIFFAKIQNDSEVQVKIYNTTTEKDFDATPDTVALLDLCTDTRSIIEIIEELSEQFGKPVEELGEDIASAFAILQEKGIISIEKIPGNPKKSKKITLKYPVSSAQIEITNRCNLSCLHCFNDSGDPCPHELTTEEIFSVIDTLTSMGVHRVTLTGGEPLLHPEFFEITDHARKAPMSVNIFTNGTLITEEHINEFKKLHIGQFNISVDSVDETIHDTFRGKKGALKKTLHAITLLKEAGFPIRIATCLSQLNKDVAVDILQYCKTQDLTDIGVAPVRASGRGVDGLAISPEEYYDVVIKQFTYLKEEFPEGIFEAREVTGKGCSIARHSIGIKSDGTILPCPACNREMGIGNVRDMNLEELWDNSEKLKTLRRIISKNNNTCKTCNYLAFCEGCIAGAFSMWGTLTCYYPYLCATYRAYDEIFGLII